MPELLLILAGLVGIGVAIYHLGFTRGQSWSWIPTTPPREARRPVSSQVGPLLDESPDPITVPIDLTFVTATEVHKLAHEARLARRYRADARRARKKSA